MVSESYRKKILESLIENKGIIYEEHLPIDYITNKTSNFKSYTNINNFLENFILEKIDPLLEKNNYEIDYDSFDLSQSDYYDGDLLRIPIKENKNIDIEYILEELFNEIDSEDERERPPAIQQDTRPPKEEPVPKNNTSNIPIVTKERKTQNPKRVDLVLKDVFNKKFLNYDLSSDAGKWRAIKGLDKEGKLLIVWENKEHTYVVIETLIFPKDTNRVLVTVKNKQTNTTIKEFFEIYRIPTNEIAAEKFFRKTLFSLLKKYIDIFVIQIEPFLFEYVFWTTDNPTYSYSFSTPSKNKIILDLINFISTARKPILDDFFEANDLKHKQGYLQTLLDSAEAAGIFSFKREGNEILIIKGPNYRAFLQGKVRRART
jgi:hypothetical protein